MLMNTELSVEELIEPLQTVIGVVEKKQSLPILSHVLIQLKDQTYFRWAGQEEFYCMVHPAVVKQFLLPQLLMN